MADRIRELAEIEVMNLPRKQGDILGCLQWTDARSGKARCWIIRIGDRVDRVTMESMDGKRRGPPRPVDRKARNAVRMES